jgi:RNase H-like domain found in reverse transcriptase
MARPVAFDSMQLKGAEKNYPVHEKELLVIIRVLRKWRADLLGTHFYVYTDHRTLENFDTQKDLL